MLAFCGIACEVCPVFIATQTGDEEQKVKVAALWSKQFKMNLTTDDIACDGCRTEDGRLFAHCRTCYIRDCGLKKNLNTCRDCEAYACEELSLFFRRMPVAKQNLEKA